MTYREQLDEAWREHLAPRAGDAPTVVSLFAGCGGSTLGYRMAGYRELAAVEWDDHAADTFRANFNDVPLYHGDVAALSVEELVALAGIEPGDLDVLDGSPPCQSFSTAGHRRMDDPRGELFREYVRLLRGLRPRVFVMENVSGLVKGKMKLSFAEILRELRATGYVVSARMLNAKWFGVPQSRERMIFVGVRDDLGVAPSHPRAQTGAISIRMALEGVEFDEVPALSPKYARMAPGIRAGECAADHDPGKGFTSIRRPYWGRPCWTLTKTNKGQGLGTILHPLENRSLSIPEAKRLGSFPDEFVLEGKFADRWARIGNSVPPLMMRAIAHHVRDTILGRLAPKTTGGAEAAEHP